MIDATLHQIGRMLAHRTSTVTTGVRRMKSGRCTTTKYQDEPGNTRQQEDCRWNQVAAGNYLSTRYRSREV
jgi:hypothetical protein